jgi:hypothetical protein
MKESMDVVVADRKMDAEKERKQNQLWLLNCLCLETDVVDVEKTDTKEDGEVVEDRGGNVAWLIQNIPSLVRSHPTRKAWGRGAGI